MPAAIDEMTLSEIACLLDTKRKGGATPAMGDAALAESIARWKAMTHRERLESCRK